jgi:hypothetical protein
MATPIDPKQQHLDDHYGDVEWKMVPEVTDGKGKGLTPAEAKTFLGRTKPVTRAKTTLAEAAKKVPKAA